MPLNKEANQRNKIGKKNSLIVSAPGSLMLLGEHAVLHGHPALVTAVDQRVTVMLTPRLDRIVRIESVLGQQEVPLDVLTVKPPFQFVLQTIQHCYDFIKHGFDLQITADFSAQIGFGSSAAVTVALLVALHTCFNQSYTDEDLMDHGREIIRAVQGCGSGADVAASVLGGLVHYQPSTLFTEKMISLYPLTVLYSGFKTKTAEVIQLVEARFQYQTALFTSLCHAIGQCAREGILSAKAENWPALGQAMDRQQELMSALGVSLPVLEKLISLLKKQETILGAKISGSGLGDCVVGLGQGDITAALPVAMSLQGVCCEKN